MKVEQLYREVTYPIKIFNSSGVLIYIEHLNGHWSKFEYNDNLNQTYTEDSHGYWCKSEYTNGTLLYQETKNGVLIDNRPNIKYPIVQYSDDGLIVAQEEEDGSWFKRKYDDHGNIAYEERSDGTWYIFTYDDNHNQTSCRDNTGFWYTHEYIRDDKCIKFRDSKGNGWDKEYDENGVCICIEDLYSGKKVDLRPKKTKYPILKFNDNNKLIYNETENGTWYKYEYAADNDTVVFYEDSKGNWYIRNFNKDGDLIYFENHNGIQINKMPQREYPVIKLDAKGNQTYYEDSLEFWVKSEYDEFGNEIYYETQDGVVVDLREKV